jgi:hypothetical protein
MIEHAVTATATAMPTPATAAEGTRASPVFAPATKESGAAGHVAAMELAVGVKAPMNRLMAVSMTLKAAVVIGVWVAMPPGIEKMSHK